MPTIELDNKLVFKFFGAYPERGMLMKGLPTMNKFAGIKYSEFARKWKPNPIDVWPVLVLKNAGGNRWAVSIQAEYLEVALQWLRDNCLYNTYKAPVKQRRKRGYKKPKY